MEFKLFDSHCHPQSSQFDEDRDEVIVRALSQGIGMLCVGTDLESSRSAIRLAERYEGLYASVGLHPNDELEDEYKMGEGRYKDEEAFYKELLQHEKVVAVGEIGLDYYRTKDPELQKKQKERFSLQLHMAMDAGLPTVIHCRDAHHDLRDILNSSEYRDATGVVHSFTGTWGDAKVYIKQGFSIGLNGIITFARDYDETVKNTPLQSMLLETDAPYLTPIPHRGRRNEPAYVVEVAKKLAEIRQEGIEQVLKTTTLNTLVMFTKIHER